MVYAYLVVSLHFATYLNPTYPLLLSLSHSVTHSFPHSPTHSYASLQIDVEGFEPMVIAGMQHLLASGLVENLIIEVSPVSPFTPYHPSSLSNMYFLSLMFTLRNTATHSSSPSSSSLSHSLNQPNWHRCVNMTRSEVANVFVTSLWDQGFQNVTIFKNNHKCCDLHVTR